MSGFVEFLDFLGFRNSARSQGCQGDPSYLSRISAVAVGLWAAESKNLQNQQIRALLWKCGGAGQNERENPNVEWTRKPRANASGLWRCAVMWMSIDEHGSMVQQLALIGPV